MKKVKPIYIMIAALVLITVIAAAAHFATRADVPEGALRVEYGTKAVELDVGRLELNPVQGAIRNGKGEEKNIDGQGIELAKVLEQAGAEDYSTITITADDEYRASITAEEAAESGRAYMLLEENGSLRLVVFGDENSKRNVSNVKLVSVS